MQKIPRAVGKASAVAIGETNSSGTLSIEGGGLSTFAGLVTSRRGKPFTVLAINKGNYKDILGAAFHPKEEPGHYEPLRHINQAVNGGNGYVVRIVPSDMEIPYVKLSTPGNSTQPVQPPVIDPTLSLFSAYPGAVVGDGKTAIVLTFSPKDKSGAAIKGLSHITFDVTGVTVSIDKVVERNGIYTANLTGIIPGNCFIRPMVANKAVGNLNAQITINQMPNQVATLDPEQCDFYLSNSHLYADGKSTVTLYLRLRDTDGKPLSIQENRVAFAGLGNIKVTITNPTEEQADPGLYTAKISGAEVGSLTVLPTVDGGLIGDIKGEILYLDKAPVTGGSTTQIDPTQSRLVASKSKVTANGSDSVVITFTARNKAGSLVANQARALSLAVFNLTGTQATAFVESSTGVYTATLTVSPSSVGDRAEIRVLYNGYTVEDLSVVLNVEHIKEQLPVVDYSASSFETSTSQAYAGGMSLGADYFATLTLRLRDVQGEMMSHRAVTFNIVGAANTGAIREEMPGVYQVDVFSYGISNVNIVPELDGMPISTFNVDIAFVAPPVKVAVIDAIRSAKTLTLAPSTIPADNTTQALLSIHIVDQDGDSMSGLEATLGMQANKPGVTFSDWLESNSGFYTASVVSDTEGDYILTAMHNGTALGAITRTLTVTKVINNPDPSKSKIEISPASINDDGSQTATLTLTLKNSSGKLITGAASHVGFEADDTQYVSITEAVETGIATGVYTSVVTGKSVKGNVVIRPQFDGVQIGNRSVSLELHDPASVQPPVQVDLSKSTITVDKTQIRADKGEKATLTFKAIDAHGAPVTDALLPHLIFKPAAATGYSVSAIASHNNGTYTATVEATSQTANGNIVIDVMYDSNPVMVTDAGHQKALSITVKMVGAVDESASVLDLSQDDIDANGTAKSVVSFTPKDVNGNVIENAVVEFVYGGVNASALDKGPLTTVKGVTSQELSSKVPANITIGVKVDGVTLSHTTDTLTVNNIVDESKCTLTANPTSLVGDGTATTTLTLTVKDSGGTGIAGIAHYIRLKGKVGTTETNLGQQAVVDGGNGVYTVVYGMAVTADSTLVVMPDVFGTDLSTVTTNVTFTRPVQTVPTVSDSTFTSDLAQGANGKPDGSPVTFTLTLKNGQDKITGRSVAFALTPNALSTTTVSSLVESVPGSGVYSGTISATAADEFDVNVTVDGKPFAIAPVHVKFAAPVVVVPTDPVVGDSTFTGSKASATADGTDKITLTLALKAGSTPIKGKTVAFVASGKKSTTTIGPVSESPDGTYKADITATAADAFDVTVTVDGSAFAITAVHAAFTAVVPTTPNVGDSTLTKSLSGSDHGTADGTTPVTMTLTLKNGTTPITGKTVVFVSTNKKATTTIGATHEASGVYTADITATAADAFDVTVTVDGTAFGVAAVHVEFDAVVPTTPNVGDSTFTAGPKVVAGSGPVALTLVLKNGSTPIKGKTVAFVAASKKSTTTIGNVSESPDGTYTADVTATAADAFDVTVTIDGAAFAIAAAHVEFDAPAHVTPTTGVVADSTFVSDLGSGAKGKADGTTAVHLTLTLKNGADVVPGRTVTFEADPANTDVTIGAATETPANSGIYIAAVTASAATTVHIKAKVDGNAFAMTPVDIEFEAP